MVSGCAVPVLYLILGFREDLAVLALPLAPKSLLVVRFRGTNPTLSAILRQGPMFARDPRLSPRSLRPQDFLHRLPSRRLIDEFVEVADFAHQRVLDILDADAADDARRADPVFALSTQPAEQRTSAMRMRFTDAAPVTAGTGTGQGATLVGAQVECGVLRGGAGKRQQSTQNL